MTRFQRSVELIRSHVREERGRIASSYRRNLHCIKTQPMGEIIGAFGDLGTFIPIFMALVDRGFISASNTLFFTGLANIFTGLYFGIPLPVQPMKAIAAVALVAPWRYSTEEFLSAGIFVGAVIGLLSVSGFLREFTKRLPLPLVKGIQVGVGLSLMVSGLKKLPTDIWDILSLLAGLAVLVGLWFKRNWPLVKTFFAMTVVFFIATTILELWNEYNLFPLGPDIRLWWPNAEQFASGAFDAGIAQVPLTVLNSIVAVVYLARDLLPDAPPPSPTAVGISVSLMNLVFCWFGAMPVCHGSGGLAAQHRLGARSGAGVIFLGVVKIFLAVFFSREIVSICKLFPQFAIGLLLLFAGLELAKMGESINSKKAQDLWDETSGTMREIDDDEKMRRFLVMILTAASVVGLSNSGLALVVGAFTYVVFYINERYFRDDGQIRLEPEP